MSGATHQTLYEWAGGTPALEKLFDRFYAHVADDPLLAPVFAHMGPDHPKHVAAWVGEVLGGPKTYSTTRGGHAHMISRHAGRGITEEQRRRWVNLLLDTADEVGLPASAGTMYAIRRSSSPWPRTTTAASRTRSCWASTASISPSSIRKPRSLTW